MVQRMIGISVFIIAVLAGCAPSVRNNSIRFGIEMAQNGLWQEAAFRWQTQLEKTGPSAALLNNLAIAAESEGQFAEAERLYSEALKLSPGNPAILENQQQFMKLKEGKTPPEDEPDKKLRGRPARGERK